MQIGVQDNGEHTGFDNTDFVKIDTIRFAQHMVIYGININNQWGLSEDEWLIWIREGRY